RPLVDQPLGGDVGFHPAERPVDGEIFAGGLQRLDHRAGIGDRGGKGFFDEDVDAVGGEAAGVARMVGGGGAEDGEVGFRGRHAGVEVGEDVILGDGEGVDGALHGAAV